MNKKIIAVIDTETIGLYPKHIYDFGYRIQDAQGNVFFEASHLVDEIVTNPKKMKNAFYHAKIYTHYLPLLDAGLINIRSFAEIYDEFLQACADYKVNVISAYNLGFDLSALQQTKRFLKYKHSMTFDYKLLDLWQFACEVLLNSRNYKKIATAQGWISPAGNFRTNAEVTHNYISGNLDGIEPHTALCDARLEGKILTACYARKKKIPYGIYNAQPWKIVN